MRNHLPVFSAADEYVGSQHAESLGLALHHAGDAFDAGYKAAVPSNAMLT